MLAVISRLTAFAKWKPKENRKPLSRIAVKSRLEKPVIVQLQNVSKIFAGQKKLKQINLQVFAGQILIIVGRNGGGKTSLIKLMAGLLKNSQGKIIRAPKLLIEYVPQVDALPILVPMRVKDFLALFKSRLPSVTYRQRRLEILHEFALAGHEDQDISLLSGGEKQKILLAKALLSGADLILLDEPDQGLDNTALGKLYALINKYHNQDGNAMVIVSHDMNLVMRNADHVVCLNGHICCEGAPESIAKDQHFIALFGSQLWDQLAPYRHHHNHKHKIIESKLL